MRVYALRDHNVALRLAKKLIAIDMLGGKCQKCGNNNVFVLEFHHVFGKKENISNLLGGNIKKILLEVKQCNLLCRNCHSELHFSGSHKKKFLLGVKNQFSCSQCGYDNNIGALDFHHIIRNTKKFCVGVSSFSKKGKHFSKNVINEINKCEVLCKNCHMMKFPNFKHRLGLIPLVNIKKQKILNELKYGKNRFEQLSVKNSYHRLLLAKWLNYWRKTRSISQTAKNFSVSRCILGACLKDSRVYRFICGKIKKVKTPFNLLFDCNKHGLISLTNTNKKAIVDKDDLIKLNKFRWCAHKNKSKWSVITTITRSDRTSKTVKMSRFILRVNNANKHVIFLNGNSLDCRRENMKIVYRAESNRFHRSSIGTSKYRWVHWDKERNKWFASMKVGPKYKNLGRYSSEALAAKIADKEYIKIYKNQNLTNFSYTDREIIAILRVK